MVEYLIDRRGGFTGLAASVKVTDQSLDPEALRALDGLLDHPGSLPSDPGADRFTYKVTRVSGSDRTIRDIPESLLPDAVRQAVTEQI